MSDRSGKRMAVYGKSGSGKSHHVKKQLLPQMKRVIIFDIEDDFEDEPHILRIDTKKALLDCLRDCWDSSFRIAYVPHSNYTKELHEVSRLIEAMMEPYKRGEHNEKVNFIVDEMDLCFGLRVMDMFEGHAFGSLCTRGRKRGVNLIGITQRPATVSTYFRGNLDRVSCFPLSLPTDWKAVEGYIGTDGENKLVSAPKYSHLVNNEGSISLVLPS